ncbi:MAG: DUF5053 domain-containing protein [Candidatus Symbiothrix sp.]|jgi:hypothetical protein|nr:DUF5053 domain-containing protein [Candidatus Symbiothrix sp.]
MELKKELEALKSYMDSGDEVKFEAQSDYIHQYFTSEEDQKKIDRFIASELLNISQSTEDVIKKAEATVIKLQLKDINEIVSLSYVAKKYFNKDRSWLHQKINGNLKNGKPAKFTDKEIDTFNFAIQDISKKLGSIAIHS